MDARKGATFTEIEEVGGACICHGGLAVFARKLTDLICYRRDNFDAVVVETTGLADPAFAQIFFVDPFLKDHVDLRAICTVVDARHIEHHLAKQVAKGCVNEAVEQIVAADIVLVNKCDLVDASALAALTKRLHALNELARIHECEYAAVPVAELLDDQMFVLEKHPAFAEGIEHLEATGLQKEHPDHDAAVGSLVLVGQGDVEIPALKSWVKQVADECGDDLWRVKGVVAVPGEPNKHVLQGVHKLVEVHPRTDSTWEEGAPPGKGGRRCQIVLIGRDLAPRRAALEASASEAFGFPLRMFKEELRGPDPHAMPDIRPILAIGVGALFFQADSLLKEGALESRVPGVLVPLATAAIVYRWWILAVLLAVFLVIPRLRKS